MQASFYIIICDGFSMNFSIRGSIASWLPARVVHVTALDIQVSVRNPMAISHPVGGQHDVSEIAL